MHWLQPLNVAFFRPLSSYYVEETEKWLWANPVCCITQATVAVLFGNMYGKAATVASAINVFWSMGIGPVKRGVYLQFINILVVYWVCFSTCKFCTIWLGFRLFTFYILVCLPLNFIIQSCNIVFIVINNIFYYFKFLLFPQMYCEFSVYYLFSCTYNGVYL